MTHVRMTPYLQGVLRADAAMSGAAGLGAVLLSDLLAGFTAIPAALLFWAGLVLLPFAAALLVLAARPAVENGAVRLVVLVNGLWALASFALPFVGVIAPNFFGIAGILAQGAAVAVFAALQENAREAAARVMA